MLPSADADSAVGRSKTPLSKQLAGPVALLGVGSPLRGWGCMSLLAFGLGRAVRRDKWNNAGSVSL